MTNTPLRGSRLAPVNRPTLPLPQELKRSLDAQIITTGFTACLLFFAGMLVASLAAAVACTSFFLISKLLSHRLEGTWPAARHSALLGMGVFTVLTVIASFDSTIFGIIGLTICCLQAWYCHALHLRSTRRFFTRRLVLVATASLAMFCGGSVGFAGQDEEDQGELESLLEKIPDEYDGPRDKVIGRLKVYRRWAKLHRAQAIQDLNIKYQTAVQAGGTASPQAVHVQAAYDWLNGESDPPQDKDAMAWMAMLVEPMAKKQEVLWKSLASLIRALNEDGHASEAAQLHQAFLGLEATRPSINGQLLIGRTFRGRRVSPDRKKTRQVQFRMITGDDAQWSGELELDYDIRSNPVFELTGGYSGPYLVAQSGTTKVFGNRGDLPRTYTGTLFGSSIIGRYSGRDAKGKSIAGVFVLHAR